MIDLDSEYPPTTDGEIAVINLQSARLRSWSRFFRTPLQPGVAEILIEQEKFTAQFVGDLSALDRVDSLTRELIQLEDGSARTALILAQIASMLHRFSDARHFLARAELGDVQSADDVRRLRLSIDQACGENLGAVMDERRRIATKSGRLEDLVALGALLADLREFFAADEIYRKALRSYSDVSPFAVAWACFQLGVLWGELASEPDFTVAEQWYRKAIAYLPAYVKARVHLAEIFSSDGRTDEAEDLLAPALASGDPEVRWRLADLLTAQGKYREADVQLEVARSGFEALLERHPLAFADHGAEFYAGSGNDYRRALELALANVTNRPTLRAFEQAHEIAVSAGDANAAASLLGNAIERWGDTAGFKLSRLAARQIAKREGATA